MAVGRMIRTSIARDSKVELLDSIISKLLYTWSITYCDRDGRMRADDTWIMGNPGEKILLWEDDIPEMITGWANAGLVIYYESNEGRYVQFHNFKKLQNMINTKTGEFTSVYNRERASEFPDPQSCKIIAGKLQCEVAHKVHVECTQDTHKVRDEVEVEREVKVEIEDDAPIGEFLDQVNTHGHSPESYKRMNANEVLTFIFGWLKKNGKDVMLPAGSMDWDKIPGEIYGIAKYIGQIVTPIRLPMILGYIRDQKGFIYGPCSPFVLKLVKQWNKDNIEAVEGL